jgi:hypothetical protein
MNKLQERRADVRLLCADLVQLIWCDYSGQEKRRIANLEDISSCGVSLQLEVPVHVGTHLRIVCDGAELAGTVRYALYRNDAYFIGVELHEDSRWSIQYFVPEHLLDPRTLAQPPFVIQPSAAALRWIN